MSAVADFWQRERERLQAEISDDARAYTKDGVRRWRSNDRVVPPSIYTEAGLECSAAQKAAYDAETTAFLAEYRKAQKNRVLSDEERFEMRAAFGPGQEVVNVITGQRFRT